MVLIIIHVFALVGDISLIWNMKLGFAILALVLGTSYAALQTGSEYLPPLEDASPTSNVDLQSIGDSSPLADDGYRYKIVKRLRLRHRRDVNELPSNEYLPPAEEIQAVEASSTEDSAVLTDDGYRYKTAKRIRYRHRRDVSELPSNGYLPPTQAAPFVADIPVVSATDFEGEQPQDSAVLAADGYHYKTVKRIRYRHRRDVSELPSNEYLPPAEEIQAVEAAPSEDSAVLADDGYRYKTVKRIRYRHRRDVSELPSNEYLPPAEEIQTVDAAPAEDTAVLANDGYRYKTAKRVVYRRRF